MFKKYFQNLSKQTIIIVVLILLLCVSVYKLITVSAKMKDTEKRIDNLSKVTSAGQAIIIDTGRDKQGRQHVVTNEVVAKSNQEKRIAVGGAYIDTVSTALKVAVDKIDELTKVVGQYQARVKLLETTKHVPDNSGTMTIGTLKVHKDDFLYAEYNPVNDSLFLDYKVALNTARYTKRKNLFAPTKSFINVWSDDPRVSVNGVKRFSEDIGKPPKRFSIGPNISYSYDFASGRWQPALGLGLQYNLIRF